MSTQITMPALSPTMEEGNIVKWHVKAGDKVEPGQVIAEIETDKATMEVEAVDEGVIEAILAPEGSQGVKVNTPIATLAGEGETPKPAKQQDATLKAERASPLPRGEGAAQRAAGEGRSDVRMTESARPADRPSPPTPSPQGRGGDEF